NMATAKQLTADARQVMKNKGSVIISAVDLQDGCLQRAQVYFWDENRAVMDIVTKADLIENWPEEEGVYVLNDAAVSGDEGAALTPVRIFDTEEDFYIRAVPGDEPCDDLGPLPSVIYLEAIEYISQLKELTR
ncbi:MAG: hypothetical protein IJC73_07750, partial [Lentisphaeria bacterium]|nr:hypothetical protein [Lentisphaeria bacterium]